MVAILIASGPILMIVATLLACYAAEGLELDWVVQQDRIAEVPQRPSRDRMHRRLVAQKPAHDRRVDA